MKEKLILTSSWLNSRTVKMVYSMYTAPKPRIYLLNRVKICGELNWYEWLGKVLPITVG
jgi:hypothetical protein